MRNTIETVEIAKGSKAELCCKLEISKSSSIKMSSRNGT